MDRPCCHSLDSTGERETDLFGREDADLRRENGAWTAYKLSGTKWQADSLNEVARNGYRVILTRARKGMVIFVPKGDVTDQDDTRKPAYYDAIASFLVEAGARELAL